MSLSQSEGGRTIPNNLDAWLAHWLTLHEVGIDLGLTRIRQVWQRLGAPNLASQHVITVAGTNGKGSSVQMLAQLLMKKGVSVATFTSPHIHAFNERITFFDCAESINVSQVADEALLRAFERIEAARDEITLSYFEASALAAFLCFADVLPDVVILEVGLGGRLDAVNIIDADATLIASIGIDHEAYLGSDIEGIAREKAGVMREGQISVYASSHMPDAIVDEAARIGAVLTHYGRDFQLKNAAVLMADLSVHLPTSFVRLGQHQCENACGVLALLVRLGYLTQSDQASVTEVLSTFALAGRFEKVSEQPLIVLDVAHNEDSVRALRETLQLYPTTGKRVAVVGMLVDKAHHNVFAHIHDCFDVWHLATLSGERGFAASQLAERLLAVSPNANINAHDTVGHAIDAAQAQLSRDDQLIIFGSFVTVAEAQTHFG